MRTDPRVINFERTNIRYLKPEQVPDLLDFFSVDVSFISLSLVLPVATGFLRENGEAVCLIKPQFEAGKAFVGKNGVVRDASVHIAVIQKVCTFAPESGLSPVGLSFSPVKGPKGNIEYLLYLKKDGSMPSVSVQQIEDVVRQSHLCLNGGGEEQ